MGISDGLARGLAIAGAGATQGMLAGQRGEIALKQQQAQLAYRNAMMQGMLGYRQGMLGLRAAGIEQRNRMPFIHALADVNQQAYFARNPATYAHFQAIANGTEDPTGTPGFDAGSGVLAMPGGSIYGSAGPLNLAPPAAGGPAAGGPTGATSGTGTGSSSADTSATPPPSAGQAATDFLTANPQAPFSADAAKPENYSPTGDYTGPNTQTAPFDQVPPPSPFAPPSLRPANLGPVRSDIFGPQPMLSLVPPQPMPQVFTGETESDRPALVKPAPAAVGAAAGAATDTGTGGAGSSTGTGATTGQATGAAPGLTLADDFARGPLPGETDRAFNQRLGTRAKLEGVNLREITTAAGLPGIIARGQTAVVNAAAAPTLVGQKIQQGTANLAGTQARTGLTQAQTAALPVTLGLKGQQIHGMLQRIQDQEDQARANLAETHRHNVAVEATGQQNAQTRAAEAQATDDLRTQQTTRLKQTIAAAGALGLGKQDVAALNGAVRLLTAQTRSASGSSKPMFTGPAADAIRGQVDSIYGRLGLKPIFGAGAPAGAPSGPASGSPAGSPPPGMTPAAFGTVKGLIDSGRFDSEMGMPEMQDATLRRQAKAAYRAYTGRDWTGGK